MRKVFCKSTEQRKRAFQIYTSIVVDNNIKYVVKEPVFEEGEKHIVNIYDNYHKLSKIYPDEVVECKKSGKNIVFPFAEGKTFEEQIRNKVKLCSDNEWSEVICEWKRLLTGPDDNIINFDNSSNFQRIFGDGEELLNDKALKITNFDCTAENIILTKQGYKFIDYEWVFDFPIPLDFCFFRVLKMFYLKNRSKVSFDELLKKAEIIDQHKIEIYEKMVDRFDLYISYDTQRNIIYENLGKSYKIANMLQSDEKNVVKFISPDFDIKKKSKIVLYGAGEVGSCYYKYLQSGGEYNLVAWVDMKYEKYIKKGYEVEPVDILDTIDFDYILIAIYNDKIAHDIIDELVLNGIPKEKLLWKKPHYV